MFYTFFFKTGFEELKEYQNINGTTRVPRSAGTLGEWVHMQVSEGRLMLLVPYLFSLVHVYIFLMHTYPFFLNKQMITPAASSLYQERQELHGEEGCDGKLLGHTTMMIELL